MRFMWKAYKILLAHTDSYYLLAKRCMLQHGTEFE
jgi:hypothetical protein